VSKVAWQVVRIFQRDRKNSSSFGVLVKACRRVMGSRIS